MSRGDYADLLYRCRPVSSHCPMDRKRRAKQFAPFDALKGFDEAIRRAERDLASERVGDPTLERADEEAFWEEDTGDSWHIDNLVL